MLHPVPWGWKPENLLFQTPFVCSGCNLCSVSEMNTCKGRKAEYRLSEPIYLKNKIYFIDFHKQ